LQILSRLSYALQDAAFREVLMRQGKPEELLGEVRRIEAALEVPARGAAGPDASGKVAD
jgi:hypothetical protein